MKFLVAFLGTIAMCLCLELYFLKYKKKENLEFTHDEIQFEKNQTVLFLNFNSGDKEISLELIKQIDNQGNTSFVFQKIKETNKRKLLK